MGELSGAAQLNMDNKCAECVNLADWHVENGDLIDSPLPGQIAAKECLELRQHFEDDTCGFDRPTQEVEVEIS